jgi:hypothetical protein
MTIDTELIRGVKFLAAILQVPRYVITEHLLKMGVYHVYQVLRDLEKRQELEKHHIEVHLLGSELWDDEDVLKLGDYFIK